MRTNTLTYSIPDSKREKKARRKKNRPCEEDTEMKMPKNEIKSTKCEWENGNMRLFVYYCLVGSMVGCLFFVSSVLKFIARSQFER